MFNFQNEKYSYLTEFYSDEQIARYCNGSEERLVDLWQRTQPREVEISSLFHSAKSSQYLVDSPDGWVPVLDCVRKDPKPIFHVSTDDGFVVNASDDHLFQKANGEWIYTRDLEIGEELITESGSGIVTSKTAKNKSEVYDLAIDHDNHRYYTAGICSHNTGKSLFLQNLALNWVQMGLNVVYITLELSEDLVGLRFDAMVTSNSTTHIMKNMQDVAMRLGVMRKSGGIAATWGNMQIKKMPMAGTCANDIRAYLQEYEIQTGRKPDAVCVDYLDLLHPNSNKINVSEQFIKDKYTSEELRALAVEWNILCATASQLNRSSIQEQDFDASHIAGGISKINTADNVLAILTTTAMKERGEYQIQFLKTRSSSGVGQRVYLKIDPESLRIFDAPDEEEGSGSMSGGLQSISNELAKKKAQSQVTVQKPAIGTEFKGPNTGATSSPASASVVSTSLAHASRLRTLMKRQDD